MKRRPLLADPAVRARLWLALIIGLPLSLFLLYFALVFGLDDLFRRCPPACREAVYDRGQLAGAAFAGADLQSASFVGANLAGADFNGADLYFANFQGANLAGANLQKANLRGALLTEADLTDADMRGAVLTGARMQQVILGGADLRNTDLSTVFLIGANLRGAIIDETTLLTPKWRLVWEIVNGGGTGRNLAGADLREAFLAQVDFTGADLRQAQLQDTDLTGADLTDAQLDLVAPHRCQVAASLGDCQPSRAGTLPGWGQPVGRGLDRCRSLRG